MSKKYYQTNAIYKYIIDNEISNYVFSGENIWMLLYGDSSYVPKLLLVVSATDEKSYNEKSFSVEEKRAMEIASRLARKAGIENKVMRYSWDDSVLKKVQYMDYQTERISEIDINQLKQLFVRCDLEIKTADVHKKINDRASSPYQEWQRDNLGNLISVIDLDLLKLNSDGDVITLYELKRSYIELEKWQPFVNDYPNFILQSNFCAKIGCEFRIVYNRRIKDPFSDDISELKIFSFSDDDAKYIETITDKEFFGGNNNG